MPRFVIADAPDEEKPIKLDLRMIDDAPTLCQLDDEGGVELYIASVLNDGSLKLWAGVSAPFKTSGTGDHIKTVKE